MDRLLIPLNSVAHNELMRSYRFRLAFSACFLSVLTLALADDGAITWGGSPKMLKGHRTVRMVSEKIVLSVTPISKDKDGYTDADCTFVFKNEGPACAVRIGFPDRTRGAFEETFARGGSGDIPHPTFQALLNFKSWVDGVPVKTTVELSSDPTVKGATYGGSWHVKVVNFKANQTLTIRDTYRQPQSGGISSSGTQGLYLNQVQYIMSTGASWKGSIGSAEVDVHLPGVISAAPLASLTSDEPYLYKKWTDVKRGEVYYTGYGAPEVRDGVLVFRKANFKPTVASDINLYWPEVSE